LKRGTGRKLFPKSFSPRKIPLQKFLKEGEKEFKKRFREEKATL